MRHYERSLDHGEARGVARYVVVVREAHWPAPSCAVEGRIFGVIFRCASAAEKQRYNCFDLHYGRK